ncbi:DUF6311 domain-containing protein [Fluviispira sanaruensis]|uniref:Glycosyltransferase RgtA/B/C/D-like domain-containing protein n=1 Tax=Fluviispira sanaruensis TaxID=2493639 RepID=A0A4P2VTC8_FLUSA|nr:DUF6311 domain-containing protein [Fluviispira sanaruensis]BBH52625.1 hypothetical protein JCM31447_10660 [Fluviispira sanaruensis]
MTWTEKVNFFSLLVKMRKNKAFLFLYFVASIALGFVIYSYQIDWMDFNCTQGRNSNSCIYKMQRLYFLPFLGFLACVLLLFLDKIFKLLLILNKNFEGLSEKTNWKILIIYSISLSVFLFNYRFSFNILDPTRIEWIRDIDKDVILNYLSWHMFRDSPWDFPLGLIHSINYPDGISIAYSDPIVLFALIFKVFSNYLPNNFQYLGLWYFISYILQGFFASLIFKNIQCKLKFKLLAVPFLIFSTVLLNRLVHVNLNAHWLILASFYLYFSKNISVKKKVIWHSILVFLTGWLHPYQTFILFAQQFALFLKIYLDDKKHLKYISIVFSCNLFLVILTWYVIGYFHLGGSYSGTSLYISNLNTFINSFGHSSLLFPLSAGGGDYEGSAYLGLGLITILVVLLFENWPKNKLIFTKENKPLLWIIGILAIIATGFNFKFGHIILLYLPRPLFIDNLFAIFRSVGRFIWPAYYFVVIFTLLTLIYRERSIYKKYILFIMALIIQLVDLYPTYKRLPLNYVQGFTVKRDLSIWEKFMGNDKNKLIFYPNRDYLYEDFWLLSKKNNYSTNIGYFARTNSSRNNENDNNTYNNIISGHIPKDTVYVVFKDNINIFTSNQKKSNFTCEYIQEFYACKNKS